MKNRETTEKTGYFYGIVLFLILFSTISFVVYLFYSLVIKASNDELTDNTIVNALITLIISVILGNLMSRKLEHRYARSLEIYKIKNSIALNIIDLSETILNSRNEEIRLKALESLETEYKKSKLYFEEEIVYSIQNLIKYQSLDSYNQLIKLLRNQVNK
ncbi:hypothetical protein J416_09184 [Gracilibacillus halophilus YIM-C55.5]|uniref:Uncharacterized protein n=1 Tax=Gracilibacillus halophilus YIM-C55.5 TaxID=1308866 RepID=N4WBU9_9BACI|nr:hypothetical protein [Gracilibacillus halophilus]ENH96739.1 hypothetical protein J416_09184 [Gracilibacillus halophilus YIM-C55.5]